MRRGLIIKIFFVFISLSFFCINIHANTNKDSQAQDIIVWTCPNHTYITREDYGICPSCGTNLIPVSEKELYRAKSENVIILQPEVNEADSEYMHYHESYRPDIRLIGRIEYNETKNIPVPAKFEGMVTMLYCKAGDHVKAGDRLARVYAPEIASIQRDLIVAKKILDRGSKPILSPAPEVAKQSLSQVLSTDDNSDTSMTVEIPVARERERTFIERLLGIGKTETPVASMTLNQRKELYDDAVKKAKEWGLDDNQIDNILKTGTLTSEVFIVAPVSGILVEKNFDENNYFNPSDILFIISDPSSLWFTVDAYEQDLPGLQYGQSVDFTVASYPGRRFSGTIVSIKPTTDAKRRTVAIGVSIGADQKDLMPGMFTFVKCPAGFIQDAAAEDKTE